MPRSILIIRLGSLGDLIHTLPAVAELRRAVPDATIDWLVDVVHREILDLVPILSSIVTLDRPTPSGWLAARRKLRARRYDVALDFQGLLKSAALARMSGAGDVLGFDRASLREPAAAMFYSRTVTITPGVHVVYKNLELAEAATRRRTTSVAVTGAAVAEVVPQRAPALEFPLRDVPSDALRTISHQIGPRFALLNCGAAWPNKRWPPERFGRLAAWLMDTHGLPSVVLWGPGEAHLAQAVVTSSRSTAIAAPETGLRDLVAIARGAALMVSGDTGPTHIAAAVGTPVVALFGPTDPRRNGPWDPADVAISRYEQCDCHYQRQCRRPPDGWCLGTITEDDVRGAIDKRLGARGSRLEGGSGLGARGSGEDTDTR